MENKAVPEHVPVPQKTNYTALMTVEIPKGSNIKYEIKDGKLMCDRILHTPMNYICNYGCFEETLADDGDPLDVCLVMANTPLHPGCYIQCKIIGVLMTSDEKGGDEKIIAVPVASVDPQYEKVNDLDDLPQSTLKQIEFFFKNYKSLEKGKKVQVDGFKPREEAWQIYRTSQDKYWESLRKDRKKGWF